MNFDIIKENTDLKELYNYCIQAEVLVSMFPDASVRASRNALEWVIKLFYVTKYGKYSSTADLFGLIEDYKFKAYLEEPQLSAVHTVRKLGNMASHAEPINNRRANLCLHALYDSVCEILKFLGILISYPAFDKTVIGNVTKTWKNSFIPSILQELSDITTFNNWEKVDVYSVCKIIFYCFDTNDKNTNDVKYVDCDNYDDAEILLCDEEFSLDFCRVFESLFEIDIDFTDIPNLSKFKEILEKEIKGLIE